MKSVLKILYQLFYQKKYSKHSVNFTKQIVQSYFVPWLLASKDIQSHASLVQVKFLNPLSSVVLNALTPTTHKDASFIFYNVALKLRLILQHLCQTDVKQHEMKLESFSIKSQMGPYCLTNL